MKKFVLFLLALVALASPGWAETLQEQVNKGGTVTLTGPVTLTDTLKITKDVILDGGGFTLSGDNKVRVIEITGGKVTIKNLTITGGYVENDTGGGILLEGNDPIDVTIENCTFMGNMAESVGGYGANGGGIYHKNGTLTVRNCRFERNSAGEGGGIYDGYNSGTLTVSECTFYKNIANAAGGGIRLVCANANDSITNCTFTKNTANGSNYYDGGGGIYMFLNKKTSAPVNCVTNCTFVNNRGTGGSEIYCQFSDNDINVSIINSLLWNADASTEKPIIGASISTGDSVTLEHCALPNNYQLPEDISIVGREDVTGWTPPDPPETGTHNGVTHSVYRVEKYSALSGLIAAGTGTATGALTNDQLGKKRRAPLTIGAVEYGGKMDFTLAATRLYPTTDSPTYSGYIGLDVKLTPSVTPKVFATGNQWEWNYKSPSTALPPGLTLEKATGVISGTPNAVITAPTDYHFTLKATSGDYTASRDLTLTLSPITLNASTTKLFVTAGVDLDTGKTVTFTPTPAANKLPSGVSYVWNVTGTAPGVTATIADGVLTLTGKPEITGEYTFNVTASATIGSITCTSSASEVKLTVSLESVTVTPFEIPFEKTEGIPKISFEATAGIPFKKDIEFWMDPDLNYTCYVNNKYEDTDTAPGVTATTNGTANFTLSGTPTQAGEYTFTFKAMYAYGGSGSDPISGTATVTLKVWPGVITALSADIDNSQTLTAAKGKASSWPLRAKVWAKYTDKDDFVDITRETGKYKLKWGTSNTQGIALSEEGTLAVPATLEAKDYTVPVTVTATLASDDKITSTANRDITVKVTAATLQSLTVNITSPTALTLDQGGSQKLEATVTGTYSDGNPGRPSYTLTWEKVSGETGITVAPDGTLKVDSDVKGGDYPVTVRAKATADNISGESASTKITVTVKEKSSESGSQDIDAVEKLLINFVAGGITVEQGKTGSTTLTAMVLGKYKNKNEYVDLSDIAKCEWTVEGKPDWLKQEENGNKVTFTVGPEAAEGWYEFNVWVKATVTANRGDISSSYGEGTLEEAGTQFSVWVQAPAPAPNVVTDLEVTANTAAMDATVGTHATLNLGEYVAVMKKWSDGTTTPAPDAALTFAPGDGWPSWLTLASNGTVTANPTADAAMETASYPYSVTASVGGLTGTGSGVLNVTVVSNPEPAGITTTQLPDAEIGKNYSAEINATGTKPIKWEIVKGDLPIGLSLDPLTGRISGAPALVELKEAGKYPFTVRVSNGINGTGEFPAERELTLKVKETPPGKSWKVTLSNSEKKAGTSKKKSIREGKIYYVTFVQKTGENVKYTNKISKKYTEKGGIQKFIPTNKPEAGMGKGVFKCKNKAKTYYLKVIAANSAGDSSIRKKVRARKTSVKLTGSQAALSGAAWAGLAADDEDDDDDELDGGTENSEVLTYYTNGEVDEDGNISAVIGTAVPNVEGAEYVYATVNDMLSALAGKLNKVIGLEFRTGTKVDTSRLRELPNLADLSIDEGDVTEIDLSGLSSLESLSLYGCRNLTSLNVSGCSSLSVVMVDECSKLVMLTGVKGCTELESLSLHGAAITALDVSGFAGLANLDVTGCEKLASLNAAGCAALETLNANGCSSLTRLDLTGVTTLTDVSLNGSKITDLDLSGCGGQNALATGQAHGSAVFATAGEQDDDDDQDEDEDDLPPAATGLKTLPLADATELTSLVLPRNSVFELFKLTGSKVKELDLSGIISMDALDLSRNKQLETLNVSSNDVLKELDVSGNEALKTLNVSNCATLEKLTANDCAALYSLNIEGCPALRELELYGAKWLTSLNCAGRSLGHLDLDGLNRLSKLECGGQNIGGVPMSQTLDLTPYAGYNPSRVTGVQGFTADGAEIETQWDPETGTATFASVPATVRYVYNTGLRDETMDVTLSLTAAPLSDGPTSDKDGGGCEVGFAGIAGLMALVGFFRKKQK